MEKWYNKIVFLLGVCILFAACGGGSDSKEDKYELLLKVDKTVLSADGEDFATLSVICNGEDVSSSSVISVNAEANSLKGNIFSTKKVGTYVFQATYDGEKTNSVTVIVGGETVFRKNILFQMFTSVDCPNCPAKKTLLGSVRSSFPQEVFIACYHGNLGVPNPFATRESLDALNFLWDELGSKGSFAPAYYDYIAQINASNMKDVVKERLTVKGEQGIALHTSLDGDKATVRVSVKTLVPLNGDYRLVVLLTENNCIYTSTKHDDVFRYCLTDLKGEKITSLDADQEWEKTYEKNIASDYKKNEMQVIAYLVHYKTDGKEAVNCQGVQLGKDKDYVTCVYEPDRNPWDEVE
jgi:lipoprotein